MSEAYVQVSVIPEPESRLSSHAVNGSVAGATVIWIDCLSIHIRPETADLADRIAAAFTEAARVAREAAQQQVPA